MAKGPVEWADRIGAASDQFKNAVITILDPTLVTTTFNVETGVTTTTGDAVKASGVAARIQPIRSSSDVSGAQVSNPSAEVRVRIQIPRAAFVGKIKKGWLIRVTSATRNPELVNYLFAVESSLNSSWRASTTIEAVSNVENDPTWSA